MYKGYKVKVAPTQEPITLDDAKTHLRVDGTEEDSLITSLIIAVRDWTEKYLGRALLTQTIKETHEGVPKYRKIDLRICPVQDAGQVVEYTDTAGATATFSATEYAIITSLDPAVLALKADKSWPETNSTFGDFTVEYKAGYTQADDIPGAIKSAMLLMIGDLYEKREDSIKQLPTAAEYLLQPYRIHSF